MEAVKPIDFRIGQQEVTHIVWRSIASRYWDGPASISKDISGDGSILLPWFLYDWVYPYH